MAELKIDYVHFSVFAADPAKDLFLDREFLSSGQDMTVSRAPNAPCLRHRDGNWWLDNDSGGPNEASVRVFTGGDNRRLDVPARLSFRLPDGENEVRVFKPEYAVVLTVTGSRRLSSRAADPNMTEAGLPEAVAHVRALFRRKPRTKTVLAALYREYLTPGFAAPKALTRHQASECLGNSSPHEVDAALKDIQAAIWGKQGNGESVPQFLINRKLLSSEAQQLVPHRQCPHRRPGMA